MKNALYGSGNSFPSIVYGYARANLRPASYSSSVAFRLQGPHTRLVINGHHVFDFQSDSQLMVVTPCVQLQNNTAHEIYFYFATRVRRLRDAENLRLSVAAISPRTYVQQTVQAMCALYRADICACFHSFAAQRHQPHWHPVDSLHQPRRHPRRPGGRLLYHDTQVRSQRAECAYCICNSSLVSQQARISKR